MSKKGQKLPYQFVTTDLFKFEGKHYLVTVDSCCDCFDFDYLHDQTAKNNDINSKHILRDTEFRKPSFPTIVRYMVR